MTARISTARLLIAAGALIAAIALATALSGEPAGAAFPGKNGKVAFGRCLKPGQEGIFTVKPNGDGLRKLTGKGRQPAWSANGKKIAYTRPTGDGPGFGLSAIYKMDANGTKQHRLTKGKKADQGPSWSPNGKQIVFMRLWVDKKKNPTYDIYKMKANGKKVHRLTKDGGYKYGPAWSPNGKKIAFLANGGIYTMNTKGKQRTKLARYGDDLSWSPDGKMIAFSRSDELKIYTMKANGKQVRAVAADTPPGIAGYLSPAWSPDGTEFAVEGRSDPGTTAGIYKIDADGANPVELAKSGKTGCDFGRTDSEPDWQPR